MKYQANPVQVDAEIIIEVGVITSEGAMAITLQGGVTTFADRTMIARYIPQPGDYLVTQSDGYVYLNPKEVFERKYSIVQE